MTPDTRYVMFWEGEMRPVTNLYGAGGVEVWEPLHASTAIVFIREDRWLSVEVFPGEVVLNPRPPRLRCRAWTPLSSRWTA